jgi:SAM-dependent methyltransferase
MTSRDRPPSWNEHNASAFQLADVVNNYHLRPPYPPSMFRFLLDLATPRGGPVLELGCGTGEIARALAAHVERIDAIDVSAPMLARARSMAGGDRTNIRWVEGRAEDAPLDGPYALAVAGASLHWMDWEAVLPRVAAQLAPDAVLAIAHVPPTPRVWHDELRELTSRYSTIPNWQNADLIGLLEGRGLFNRAGAKTFDAESFQRTIDEYIDAQHATSALTRERMGAANARAFDDAVRAMVTPHARNGILELSASAEVTWGVPLNADG